jgi:hypothetical protein
VRFSDANGRCHSGAFPGSRWAFRRDEYNGVPSDLRLS